MHAIRCIVVELVLVGLGLGWVAGCWGQSAFTFRNRASYVGLDAPVFDAQGMRLYGTDYVAVLYGGLTPDSLAPALEVDTGSAMAPVPFTHTPSGLTGYFRYQGFGVSSVFFAQVIEYHPVWLQVRAWDMRLGGSYEEVASRGLGGYGESNLFQGAGGNPFGAPPGIPGELLGMQSFSLRPVIPEPASVWFLLTGLPLALWGGRSRSRRLR